MLTKVLKNSLPIHIWVATEENIQEYIIYTISRGLCCTAISVDKPEKKYLYL